MSFKNVLKTLLFVSIFLFASSSVFGADFSLKFDGIDDYVNCGNDASLNFGTGDFSYTAWIKGSGEYYYQEIIDKYNETTEADKILYVSNDKITLLIIDQVGEWAEAQAPVPVNDNLWHHIVATRSSSTIMIYVDGDFKDSDDASLVGSTDAPEDLTIGGFLGGGYAYEGLIDKVRIYNRVLSAEEVGEHYNGIFENETGLKLNLPMDEGTGSIAYDYSGLGNHGTIYGATYYYSIVEIPTNFVSSAMAYAGDLFTDLNLVVILAIGLPLGFWAIKRVISLIKVK